MNDRYSLRELAKILGTTPARITSLITAGFVTPERGPRRQYVFTFQDLIVLKMAHGLTSAQLPARRISRSLKLLRTKLPDQAPLTGLRIEAVGNEVVVNEGDSQWAADSGQYLLGFEVFARDGDILVLERDASGEKPDATGSRADASGGGQAQSWFALGFEAEQANPQQAGDAYESAIQCDPTQAAAYSNLGRLCHEQGRLADAEDVYRRGLAHCPQDATLLFNFGVLLEDLRKNDQAADCYRRAVAIAPDFADAHFNLGRLYYAFGKQREAVRHFSAYRQLTPAS